MPQRSHEYQRLKLDTDFLSEGLIFVYQQPHHRITEIGKQHHNQHHNPFTQ